MKAEIGYDEATKQHYMSVLPESPTERTMLRFVSPLLGLTMREWDGTATLRQCEVPQPVAVSPDDCAISLAGWRVP